MWSHMFTDLFSFVWVTQLPLPKKDAAFYSPLSFNQHSLIGKYFSFPFPRDDLNPTYCNDWQKPIQPEKQDGDIGWVCLCWAFLHVCGNGACLGAVRKTTLMDFCHMIGLWVCNLQGLWPFVCVRLCMCICVHGCLNNIWLGLEDW